ncbi:MAG: adenosylcobinamide-phosphate synthase CbiB [Nitrospirae bacterium]|nr:adenosylcobinamide-phosphate synthase CbiB [Nitrospirota bacterium]
MISATVLLLAFGLDLLIGDPRWLPHPVRFIGSAISTMERLLRRSVSSPSAERAAGIVLVLAIVAPVYFLTDVVVLMLNRFSDQVSILAGTAALVVLTATTIATQDLLRSAGLVISSIREGSLEAARKHVSMIVGRDTGGLSEQGVLRATIETLAENLSDGIVAPLFYLALGGLPLAMAYKAINTLDSMVGYKNDQYRYFGWAAARVDDAANYLPARITGLIIAVAAFLSACVKNTVNGVAAWRRSLAIMARDGGKHSSPNSGVPEASMAGALGVTLGGPNWYNGVLSDKPVIGDPGREDYLLASDEAMTLVKVSAIIAAALAGATIAARGMS